MADTREILIQSFAAKIGRPPRRQPRKIEGGFMKVKSSRGIVMRLICCMALVVLSTVVAFSQTPKSGALLAITSDDNSVNLKIYDSQIHTGSVRTNSCDQIPTDAYVLQGGAPTGCDSGDAFETANGNGVTGTATLGGFTVTSQYICASTTCGLWQIARLAIATKISVLMGTRRVRRSTVVS